ncbi:hypothetical protein U1Q18_044675 [Sarracenia purpurea var. burkii]
METSTDPATSEPFINLDLISEHNDGNLVENDFHFSYLTVESSTDPPRRYGYRHFEINDESNEHRNNFEGNLVNVGFSVDTWSAIEYFWNRLSFNEQVSKASVLLNRKPQFQKQLFSKMNEFQKCHVLSTVPFEVTMNFWRQKSHERFAYLTWLRIKDAITYEQFTKFIYALLTESLPDHVEKVRYLVKIWNSSSDDFINRALNSMRNTVIDCMPNTTPIRLVISNSY